MNTQRNIALNALTLLVRKNDPTLFDNPDIFEKNLVLNGATAGSEEVNALKQSLVYRMPWKIRKNGVVVDVSFANTVAGDFADKSDVLIDLAIWATRSWIAALGLKLKAAEQEPETKIPEPKPESKPEPEAVKESATIEPKVNAAPAPGVFSKPNGRIGIVFGEDSSGVIKVFNAWYNDASKAETSGMAATPVKLKTEPVVLFKAAPKKKSDKPKAEQKSKGNTEKVDSASSPTQNTVKENTNDETVKDADTEYKVNPIEKKAMSILEKGEKYTYEVIKMLAPVAVAGSAFSCRLIGELYYRGHGVKQDFNAAKAWLEKAANMGDAESQYLMGNMYQYGMGVGQNLSVAMQYFQKAAEQGHKKAIEAINLVNGLVGY